MNDEIVAEMADKMARDLAHAIDQEIIKNTPAEVTALCMICGSPIPIERERKRFETCKAECNTILKNRRRYLADQKKCVACLRPSTPQERIDFRNWRKSQRPNAGAKGRPPARREDRLRDALMEASKLIENLDAGDLWVNDKAGFLARAKALIDETPALTKKAKEVKNAE